MISAASAAANFFLPVAALPRGRRWTASAAGEVPSLSQNINSYHTHKHAHMYTLNVVSMHYFDYKCTEESERAREREKATTTAFSFNLRQAEEGHIYRRTGLSGYGSKAHSIIA